MLNSIISVFNLISNRINAEFFEKREKGYFSGQYADRNKLQLAYCLEEE